MKLSNTNYKDSYNSEPTDLFGYRPAATKEEIAEALKPLLIAFPKCNADFWGLLKNKIVKKAWCKERIMYMVEQATEDRALAESYRYDRLATPDILNMPTAELHTFEPQDATHFDLVLANVAGRKLLVRREDAEFGMYTYSEYVATTKVQEQSDKDPYNDIRADLYTRFALPLYNAYRGHAWAGDYAAAVYLAKVEPLCIKAVMEENTTKLQELIQAWRNVINEDVATHKARYLDIWRVDRYSDKSAIRAFICDLSHEKV